MDFEKRLGPMTRGHCFKLANIRSTTKIRQNFFVNRIVTNWNSLSGYVVDAPSIVSFERRLNQFRKGQEVKFDYAACLSRPQQAKW